MKNFIFSFISGFLFLLLPISTVYGQEKGVIILAHGAGEQWNSAVIEAAEPLKQKYRVEVAFGMANYVSIYNAVKTLEAKGVSKIVAIPLFISSYSSIIRQTEYLLGERDSLADPMGMMHHVKEYKK